MVTDALLIVSVAIALTAAHRAGQIDADLRRRLAAGPTPAMLRELSISLAEVDCARAEGMRTLSIELGLAGGWRRAIDGAPAHAREVWDATAEWLSR